MGTTFDIDINVPDLFAENANTDELNSSAKKNRHYQ